MRVGGTREHTGTVYSAHMGARHRGNGMPAGCMLRSVPIRFTMCPSYSL